MKKPIDINEYMKKREKKLAKQKEDENTKIFKELIKKPIKELDSEQMKVYNEIGVVLGFTFKEIHSLLILDFRGCMYIVNILNGGVFEYIGKLEEIIEYYIQ